MFVYEPYFKFIDLPVIAPSFMNHIGGTVPLVESLQNTISTKTGRDEEELCFVVLHSYPLACVLFPDDTSRGKVLRIRLKLRELLPSALAALPGQGKFSWRKIKSQLHG